MDGAAKGIKPRPGPLNFIANRLLYADIDLEGNTVMKNRICPFSATLVRDDFACRHASQVVCRGGVEIACASAADHQRCTALLQAFKAVALPAFEVSDDLTQMPHSVLVKIQFGGLLVLLVLPLAAVGGVIALRLLNLVTFQPMDLLTMIGFIILLGLVVNNAILLVYQTRQSERQGMPRRQAVEQAVRLRLRPILMTTLTSVFGMLPLLLMPGAGTELYRGLAGVIVGGMLVSAFFTLLLLPAMLRSGESASTPA